MRRDGKSRPPFDLVLAAALLCQALPGPARGWSVFVDGTGNAADEAEALALDSSGDVIAAGRLYDAVRFYDFVVLKRNGVTGGPIWQRSAFGSGGAGCCGVDEGAHAVAVDAAGTVFAAGHLEFDPPPAGRAQDLAVIRFNPGGELWRALLDGGRSSVFVPAADLARDVALDPAGNPVAAGRLTVPVLTPEGWSSELVVIKLAAANGAPLWTRRIQGSAPLALAANSAEAVALDAGGDVFAAGSLLTSNGQEFAVLKLDGADGGELWRRELGPGRAYALAIDAAGDVFAAGEGASAYALKLDGETGDTLWDEPSADRIARSLALDRDGNPMLAGHLRDDAALFAVALDAASGAERWPAVVETGTAGTGSARGVALDPAGDVLVAGYLGNSGTNRDLCVLKLAGASGAELWRREIDGGFPGDDEANAVAVDAEGHVVVAGRTDQPVGRVRFSVLKLRGRDGTDLAPCGDVDGDEDVDLVDLAALRGFLSGELASLAAPERCSVFGGARDCDLVDRVALARLLADLSPRPGSRCAAVVE